MAAKIVRHHQFLIFFFAPGLQLVELLSTYSCNQSQFFCYELSRNNSFA